MWAGIHASHAETYDNATATTAVGRSIPAIGMTSAFAGSDSVVTRWKYQAMGSVRANWMMADPITNSAAASKTEAVRTVTKFATGLPTISANCERISRRSERNCAALVGKL